MVNEKQLKKKVKKELLHVFPKDIIFKCKAKIAYDSWDHIHPKGTKHDNSVNRLFNNKLYRLFFPKYAGQINGVLKVLDLGCAGGGFVRECMNDGCFAMGLEGSDYSKKMKRAEWSIIPESLFLCDISRDFEIYYHPKKEILKFHVITAWEVLEHMEEDQILGLIKNIKRHLQEDGLFIASVANWSDKVGDIDFHRTQKPKKWWVRRFAEQGLYNLENLYPFFDGQYIRGRSHKETKESFHLIMSPNPSKAPKPIRLGIKERVVDRWKGSLIQRFLLK